MLKDIEKLLNEGNFQFQRKIIQNPDVNSFDQKIPRYPILFLTCMDPRIDVHQIFQLNPGDVFILRNAGNIYTLDAMRSILISIYKYKIKYIIILGHLECGMTRININELRQKLPNKFLKRLSINYSNLLSKLSDFFKPFDNEIRNIIQQINNLQEIKALFPDVEIIGMLYDIQTGWIFRQEDFRDLLIKENHFKIYKGLLFEKNQQLSKFLKSNSNENIINQTPKEIIDEPQVNEMNFQEIEAPDKAPIRNDELQTTVENKKVDFQIKMPKIPVPKIYIPKINVFKSKIKKTVKR